MELMSMLLPSKAGKILGCSLVTVRMLLLRGKLRGIETPYGWLVEPESVYRLIEGRQGQRWHPGGLGRGRKGPVERPHV